MKNRPHAIGDLVQNLPQGVVAFNHNRVFGTDGFYPYQKHGWRARARNGRFWHATLDKTLYIVG
jgi:hypothetical protein